MSGTCECGDVGVRVTRVECSADESERQESLLSLLFVQKAVKRWPPVVLGSASFLPQPELVPVHRHVQADVRTVILTTGPQERPTV